ncbi:cell division protein FtsA [Ktedonobacter racemifer DSM 44963]|uniref:Cell division protein FtsA n=2 Tax=Ktedonobacter racemifer TaxID=363277 RepID=D6TWK0_KTERA|nr:cell division protein FtsA [Ktedonobacter racemifer DSM 44963]
MELSIEELSQGEVLPSAIYLVGGGSALPDILTQLTAFPWQEKLPFSRPPEIRVVKPEMVSYISNPQQAQNNYQYVTPLALGYVAVELENGETNVLEPLLYQAIDKLNL